MLLTTTNTIEGKEITQYPVKQSSEQMYSKISSQASGILSEDAQVLTKAYYAKQKKPP